MEDPLVRKGWEDLANAVVLQAVEDYERACRALRHRPDLRERAAEYGGQLNLSDELQRDAPAGSEVW